MKCIVVDCRSKYHDKSSDISFFNLPSDERIRAKWLAVLKLSTTLTIKSSTKVCSLHFNSADISTRGGRKQLRVGAIPSAEHLETIMEIPSTDPEAGIVQTTSRRIIEDEARIMKRDVMPSTCKVEPLNEEDFDYEIISSKFDSIEIQPIKIEDETLPFEKIFGEAYETSTAGLPKCGEIFLENHSTFILVCAFCKSTYSDLTEFGEHYLQQHRNDDYDVLHYDPVMTKNVQTDADISEFEIKDVRTIIPEFVDVHKSDDVEELLEGEENIEKSELNNVEPVKKSQGEGPFICSDCNKSYSSCYSLRNHSCKPKPIQQKVTRPKRPKSNPVVKKAASRTREEKQQMTDPDLYCELCRHQFLKVETFRSHALHKHSIPPAALKRLSDYLQCMYCREKFTRLSDWRAHENEHRNEKNPYHCPYCPKRFSCGELKIHLNSHTGEKPFKCDQCPSGFTSQGNLYWHKQRIHLKAKPFPCNLCKMRFVCSVELKLHIKRNHTGEKPFQCETCGKCFLLLTLLKLHYRRHTNTRNHKCSHCPKSFYTWTLLANHMRVHSNERKYSCDICDKRFKAASALRMHQKLHSDSKQYKCKICGKEFAQFAGLYSHKKSH